MTISIHDPNTAMILNDELHRALHTLSSMRYIYKQV